MQKFSGEEQPFPVRDARGWNWHDGYARAIHCLTKNQPHHPPNPTSNSNFACAGLGLSPFAGPNSLQPRGADLNLFSNTSNQTSPLTSPHILFCSFSNACVVLGGSPRQLQIGGKPLQNFFGGGALPALPPPQLPTMTQTTLHCDHILIQPTFTPTPKHSVPFPLTRPRPILLPLLSLWYSSTQSHAN